MILLSIVSAIAVFVVGIVIVIAPLGHSQLSQFAVAANRAVVVVVRKYNTSEPEPLTRYPLDRRRCCSPKFLVKSFTGSTPHQRIAASSVALQPAFEVSA